MKHVMGIVYKKVLIKFILCRSEKPNSNYIFLMNSIMLSYFYDVNG
ncbi:MAG: hypothetical protein K0R05_16 [Anaerocolumna sp.]|jgi:hypothetical protein|nr:hypothetical protein [Anaerocolumna sp.]